MTEGWGGNETWRQLARDLRRSEARNCVVPEPAASNGLVGFAFREIARVAYAHDRDEPWWTDIGGEA